MNYDPIWGFVVEEMFGNRLKPNGWAEDCTWLFVDAEREWLGKQHDEELSDTDVDSLMGKLHGFLPWVEERYGSLEHVNRPARLQVILHSWYEAGCSRPGVKEKGRG